MDFKIRKSNKPAKECSTLNPLDNKDDKVNKHPLENARAKFIYCLDLSYNKYNLFRFFEEQVSVGRAVCKLLESGEEISILDPSHSKNSMVLLVRHCFGSIQYHLRCCGTLQTTQVAHFIFV